MGVVPGRPQSRAMAWSGPVGAAWGTASVSAQTLDLRYMGMFALVVVGILLLIGLALLARKLLLGIDTDDESTGETFSLAQLRALHRDGKISDEEFERARAVIIDRSRAILRYEKRPTSSEGGLSNAPHEPGPSDSGASGDGSNVSEGGDRGGSEPDRTDRSGG